MAFYAVQSERQFREQTGYSAPFKWSWRLQSLARTRCAVEDEPFRPTTCT